MGINPVGKLEKELISALEVALDKVLDDQGEDIEKPEIEVEVPREKEHGDYATNLAMVLAGQLNTNPRKLAEEIVAAFDFELVAKMEIAGPGFINFHLKNDWLYQTVEQAIEAGEDYGQTDKGQGEKVQIEFVSTNPTGPLHVGHSRGAVVGDVLANILAEVNYDVFREYLINDAGNQMDLLGESTYLRYQELFGEDIEMPDNSYQGNYIIEVAKDLKEEYGDKLMDMDDEEALVIAREKAYAQLLSNIKEDLAEFKIEFDNWFSERTLHEEDKIQETIDLLREKGYIYDKDGAVWFASSEFGDDKDRVAIKSDGSPTYMAADMAYHYNKLARGFDHLINIWGADHHGYIDRMKAVIEAFGYERDTLEIIVVQIVTLLRDGKKVPMSKRAGDFVTMREVMEEVGRDAARYFYTMRSTDSHFDFDLDLAKQESTDNPVYYIQYANARIHSILDNAGDLISEVEQADLSLLQAESEVDLMKMIARYPDQLELAADRRAPHMIANYAHELAGAFHGFYNSCRVIIDDKNLSLARLQLVRAAKIVLENVLKVLGVSAPEEM
ncbi:MAG: arginine--tRNA ligase [Bacillota bacterium]